MRRVFISSTTADLAQYREEAVEKVIQDLNTDYKGRFQLVEVTMDTEGQTGERETAVDVSRQWVNASDWVVLIVGWHYGYVAPDQVYSVTELEYRQSQEGCQPPKPCFVYVAGEHDDGERAYRALSRTRERTDLAHWKADGQDPEAQRKLKQFKNGLRAKRYELFSDLDDFLRLLRASLKKRIEDELQREASQDPPSISHFPWVLIQLMEPIQRFLEEIKLLATLKRIHDRLHKIRQFGIRRWREEVLTQWHEGVLSGEAEITFHKGLREVEKYRNRLDGFLLQLPDEAVMPTVSPKTQIQKVLQSPFGAEGTEQLSDRTAFERDTERFASRVQAAFSATNRAMLERAGVLRRYFEALLTAKLSIPSGSAMTRQDEVQLSQQVEELKEHYECLQSVLGRHHDWQQMHDQLERLDTSKGSSLFAEGLDSFLDNCEAMHRLLADALHQAEASGRVESWQGKIGDLTRHLDALAGGKNEPSYERMRKAFDDLFYDVDVETLSSVEASEICVGEFDKALKELLSQVQGRLSGARFSPGDL
jgi:hypothetical protein